MGDPRSSCPTTPGRRPDRTGKSSATDVYLESVSRKRLKLWSEIRNIAFKRSSPDDMRARSLPDGTGVVPYALGRPREIVACEVPARAPERLSRQSLPSRDGSGARLGSGRRQDARQRRLSGRAFRTCRSADSMGDISLTETAERAMSGAIRKGGFPADLHQDLGQWPRERPPRGRNDMTRRPGLAHLVCQANWWNVAG